MYIEDCWSEVSFSDKFINESKKKCNHCLFLSFVTDLRCHALIETRKEKKQKREKGRGKVRARQAENKKRAKRPAGPVMSCDRK